MQTNSLGATTPTIRPTRINWVCMYGIVLHYQRKTAGELVSSGLLTPDELPARRAKLSRNGALHVFAAKGGTFNVRLFAEDLLARDTAFQRFLGGLLADTRLPLVRGELARCLQARRPMR